MPLPALALALLSFSGAPLPSSSSLSREAAAPDEALPVCGLGASFHAGRRKALAAELERGVLLVRGLPIARDYTPFRQDKTFWYLTGVESPDAALALDCASGREILLLPAADPVHEAWNGELWDVADAWIGAHTGFAEVREASELIEVLGELLEASEGPLWLCSRPWVALAGVTDAAAPFDRRQAKDPLDGRPSREQALRAKLAELFPEEELADCAGYIDGLRLIKEPEEQAAMRRAAELGARALSGAMAATRAGQGEWELAALLERDYRAGGSPGPAYAPIVGSGPNALVLHYVGLGRRLAPGEVVLVDAGPELDHYTTDITRTWPVDGRFSARAAEIYDAVLAANEAGIAAVEPGRTMSEINEVCVSVLLERGFTRDFILHGTCHWIGLEVHDAGGFRTPFEPGMALTVEPGLYDPEAAIGVRIEDVVVVTAAGAEVLTAGVPKARAAVEALVQSGHRAAR